MFRIRSLGTKISLYAGSLILLFCIGLSFLAYNSGSSAVIAEVEQALTLQAQEAARYIDSRIELHLSVLETIAERPEMKSMIWGLQKSIVETEAERLDEYLAIGVVDRNGSARYSDGSTAELGDREHVQRALAGESVVSNILTARVGDSLVLMYAVPIRDDAGQVVGSLIGRSDGTVLSEITSNLGFGENGWAYIFNNDGTLYADQDLQRVIEQRNLLTDRGELADLGRAVKELGIGETGVIRFQEGGIKKMSGLAPIPSTDWIVGVGALEADVLGNVNTLRTFLILISLVFIALGIVMAIGIARQIANPLREVQRVIEAVARGDLTQSAQVKAQDEVGRVAAALNETIKRVRDVVEQLAATTGRLSATSQAMAAASEEVSASIEEVASTTNEFSGNLDEISGNAQTMNTNVREIATKAATGEGAILEIVEQIRSIHTTTQTLAETISQLGGLSDQIGNIVNVIGDIADQTNLLALNAAIEAARAGEHGRGFAVVAEEVRDLAEKSAEATTEVTSLIAQIQTQVSEAVVEMNSGAKEAEVAVDNVGASGKLLGDILAEIEDIVGVVERITRGLEQTNLAGHEIASATEEQAASIEQVASSAQDLSLLGTRLTKLVEHFRLEV